MDLSTKSLQCDHRQRILATDGAYCFRSASHQSSGSLTVSQDHRREQIIPLSSAPQSAPASPQPSLGIDIDGCVDEAPLFFQVLTNCWPGKVIVISFRSDQAKAEAYLAQFKIRYDELILVRSFAAKAEVIREYGILVFFDDQPEILKHIPAETNVLLFRNEGNFDFEDQKWMFSDKTGKLV
jgi:hypothetical protein